MNALNFSFENLPITVLVKDDAPWFIAAQVAKAIHLTNPSVAIRTLRNCERSKVTIDGRETNIISESGMYTLILRSQDAIKEGTPAFRFRVKVANPSAKPRKQPLFLIGLGTHLPGLFLFPRTP